MDNGASSYRRFLEGNNEAIIEIIEEYRPGLQLYLLSLTGNISDAEDMTQETFVKLFTKKPKFKEQASFRTWLYTIGRNITLNFIKRQSKLSLLGEKEACEEDTKTLEEMYIADENKIIVHRAMEKLRSEYREILWLTYFEDFSNRESAEVLNKNIHSVEMLISRARKALKEQLGKDGFIYENEYGNG